MYKVKTDRGRWFHFTDDDKAKYIDIDAQEKECNPENCEGKYVKVNRYIYPKNPIENIYGLKLNFNLGYIIGCSFFRSYDWNFKNNKFLCYFPESCLRTNYINIASQEIDDFDYEMCRRAIGNAPARFHLYGLIMKSKKLCNLYKILEIDPHKKMQPRNVENLPKDFRDGIFLGLFDNFCLINGNGKYIDGSDKYRIEMECVIPEAQQALVEFLDYVDINYRRTNYKDVEAGRWMVYVDLYNLEARKDLFLISKSKEKSKKIKKIKPTEPCNDNIPIGKKVARFMMKIFKNEKKKIFEKAVEYKKISRIRAIKYKEELQKIELPVDVRNWLQLVGEEIRYEIYERPIYHAI